MTVHNQLSRIFDTEHGGTLSSHAQTFKVFRMHNRTVNNIGIDSDNCGTVSAILFHRQSLLMNRLVFQSSLNTPAIGWNKSLHSHLVLCYRASYTTSTTRLYRHQEAVLPLRAAVDRLVSVFLSYSDCCRSQWQTISIGIDDVRF